MAEEEMTMEQSSLPEGWVEKVSRKRNGMKYFFHEKTGESSWTRPETRVTPHLPEGQAEEENTNVYVIAHGRCSEKREDVVPKNTTIVFYVNKGEGLVNKTTTADWESNAFDMYSRIRGYVESGSHPEDPPDTKGPHETYTDMVVSNDDDLEHMGVYDSSYRKIMDIPPGKGNACGGIHLSKIVERLFEEREGAPVPLKDRTLVVHVVSCRGVRGVKSTLKKVGGKKSTRKRKRRR